MHFHDEIKMREQNDFFFRMRLLLDILSNQIEEYYEREKDFRSVRCEVIIICKICQRVYLSKGNSALIIIYTNSELNDKNLPLSFLF